MFPENHFLNWQQDPHGNYLARFVFPDKADCLQITVDLHAEMTVINPFDFFVQESAESFPFKYESWLTRELRPFLETTPMTPRLRAWLATAEKKAERTIDLLVALNQRLQQEIEYRIRLEPGVQTPEETLTLGSGSCRDSAWLLVQIFRQLGLAARFVSGYLIQLTSDVPALDGPSGPTADFTDLHAWSEVYLPGAGWIGLDPTSGMLASEGHLPLACTPDPQSAAPISGSVESSEVAFSFHMSVTRIHEDPRVTKPYRPSQWREINMLGVQVDRRLQEDDVRLTMGGEPTFVSIDDMDGPEWNVDAVGPHKRRLSHELIRRLKARFGPGGLLHFGQGKWYPGEQLPRWALACLSRVDGEAIWTNEALFADESHDYGFGPEAAKRFSKRLAHHLGVHSRWIVPVYEDVMYYLWKEQQLPVNVTPKDSKLKDPEERSRMARVFQRGLDQPVGFVMPLTRQWRQAEARWRSGPWPVRPERMFCFPAIRRPACVCRSTRCHIRLPARRLPFSRKTPVRLAVPCRRGRPTAGNGPLPPRRNCPRDGRCMSNRR